MVKYEGQGFCVTLAEGSLVTNMRSLLLICAKSCLVFDVFDFPPLDKK